MIFTLAPLNVMAEDGNAEDVTRIEEAAVAEEPDAASDSGDNTPEPAPEPEHEVKPEVKPETKPAPKAEVKTAKAAPETGDTEDMTLWLILTGMAVTGIVTAGTLRRRNNR